MDKLTNYRQIIQNALINRDKIANTSSKKKLETCLIFDENHDHYLGLAEKVKKQGEGINL